MRWVRALPSPTLTSECSFATLLRSGQAEPLPAFFYREPWGAQALPQPQLLRRALSVQQDVGHGAFDGNPQGTQVA